MLPLLKIIDDGGVLYWRLLQLVAFSILGIVLGVAVLGIVHLWLPLAIPFTLLYLQERRKTETTHLELMQKQQRAVREYYGYATQD